MLIAKADIALSVLLTSISSILSFDTVPLLFWIFGLLMPELSGTVELPIFETLIRLFILVVLPVGLGMIWLYFKPAYVVPRIHKLQKYTQLAFYAVLILLMIESSIRNLAVAFLIATTVLNRIDIAVLPSVYFLAVLVVSLGFAQFWRRRKGSRTAVT